MGYSVTLTLTNQQCFIYSRLLSISTSIIFFKHHLIFRNLLKMIYSTPLCMVNNQEPLVINSGL